MEIKKLNNKKEDNEIWDNFLLKSKKPNIFSHSLYDKKNIDLETNKYLVTKGTEIVASFRLYSKDRNIFNGNSLYCPINYRKILDQNKSSLHHEKNKILKILINELVTRFQQGSFCLDYKTTDLREFEFYNYDNNNRSFFIEKILYTTILNTSSIDKDYEYLSDSSFFINCAETTRQQIRYSQNKDYSFLRISKIVNAIDKVSLSREYDFITADIDEAYLANIENARADKDGDNESIPSSQLDLNLLNYSSENEEQHA